MAIDFWLPILIVSSLAPIPLRSELVSNESAIVPQWSAPPQMYTTPNHLVQRAVTYPNTIRSPVQNIVQNQLVYYKNDSIASRKTFTANEVKSASLTPKAPYDEGFYRGATHGSANRPNYAPNGYQSGGAYTGARFGVHYPQQNYVPMGGHGGYGYGGGYDRPNLLLYAQLDQCSCPTCPVCPTCSPCPPCSNKDNATVLILLDRYRMCYRQTIYKSDSSTITARNGHQVAVNQLDILFASVTPKAVHIVIELLGFVTSGPNSLEGKFVFIRAIVSDSQLTQKCSGYDSSANIKCDDVTLLITEQFDVAGCMANYYLCFEKIRASSATTCLGSAALI